MSKTRNTSPTKRVLSILRISLCAALLCIFPFLLEAQNDLSTSIGLVGVDNASEQGCGYMNRIYVLQLENSGNSNLSGLQIDLPLGQANQLGDALIDIVDIEILGSISSYTPTINIDFDASSDPVLMGDLAMNAGDQISVRIEIELDPSDLSLLSNTGIQVFAYQLNQATGSIELLDASDGGFLYEYTTWNQPGDTGGSDDPLVFDISYLTSQILSLNNNLNISLGQSCSLDLNIDMLAENPSPGSTELELPFGGYYDYQLYDNSNQLIGFDDLHEHLGESIMIQITHVVSCASYWTQIQIGDNLPPAFENSYTADTVSCFMDFNTLEAPIAYDNCGSVSYHLVQQEFIDSNICDDETELVRRYWVSRDESLNESATAIQDIFIVRDYQIDFPNDQTIECTVYNASNEVIDATQSGSGIPVSAGGEDLSICNYSFVYSDQILPTCSNSFKIFRTWTVLDWCTGNIILNNDQGEDNIQIIEVRDTEAPEIIVPSFSLSATESGVSGTFDCYSLGFVPAPVVSDACNDFEIYIITPVGEAVYINGNDASAGAIIPEPGLTIGSHELVFQALDYCGNVSEKSVIVDVVDDITPTMICDEWTQVSLNNLGIAEVNALTFDDGSFDNCCVDGFTVSRDAGLLFNETVVFDCADVGDTLDVVLRLKDCFTNFNQCNVKVLVEDKINPVAFPPTTQTSNCQIYYNSILPELEFGNYSILDQFGTIQYYDNCGTEVSETVDWVVNTCGDGIITRTWIVTDDYGNQSPSVSQQIHIESISDWQVDFPQDVTFDCNSGVNWDAIPEPIINNQSCHQIGVSFTDEVFEFQGGSCKTILRHWSLINWCTFPTEPVVEHTQVIEIIDDLAPVFNVIDQVFYIPANACDVQVDLNIESIEDCSDSISIAYMALNENGAFWTPGEYVVSASVSDWCNNQSSQSFEVSVLDTIAPTPFAQDQFNIDLGGNTTVEIHAEAFDQASFDNCSEVYFSFSENTADTIFVADCDQLGLNQLEFWVTDVYGNASFVTVQLNLTDNMGVCGNAINIFAFVTMPDGLPVGSAELLDQEDNLLDLSASDGSLDTEIDLNMVQSLYLNIPSDDIYNGVSTFDLVIITKHILGMQAFDSPYQYWAADVNGSKTVTTLDMVYIQKVILGINTSFPVQKNWISYFDTGNAQAWAQSESMNCQNLQSGDELSIKAIKLGDVNFSAVPE
jgi:hypothetical protein